MSPVLGRRKRTLRFAVSLVMFFTLAPKRTTWPPCGAFQRSTPSPSPSMRIGIDGFVNCAGSTWRISFEVSPGASLGPSVDVSSDVSSDVSPSTAASRFEPPSLASPSDASGDGVNGTSGALLLPHPAVATIAAAIHFRSN